MLFYFVMRYGKLCSIKDDPLQIEVSKLKGLLSKEMNVNQDDLILIANGGLCIQDGLLGNYNCADSKENPVFVYIRYRKGVGSDVLPENPLKAEYLSNLEKLKQVMTKTGNTFSLLLENDAVTACLVESSRRFFERIDCEIRNQHLLFEGWSAALANLWDSLTSVEKRIEAMVANLDKFFNNELENGLGIMDKFAISMTELEKVPILPALLSESEKQDGELGIPSNLLQWVLSQDNRIQVLINEAQQAYNELLGISDGSQVTLEYLSETWGKIGLIGTAYKNIEIGKGLVSENKPAQTIIDEETEETEKTNIEKETHTSTRSFLKRLEFLSGVREKSEKGTSLIQTHKEYMEHTVRQCRETGGQIVLSDHCSSARSQLENISKQYTYLWENVSLTERSKFDMTGNIDSRKNWLQQFQTKICEIDDSIFLVKEKMKRVRTGLSVLEQMRSAPVVYAKGIGEIVRRQHYLDIWYSWGTNCSKISQEIKRKDREARMVLDQDFENHFIQSLFSSLYSFSLPKLGTLLLQSERQILPKLSETDIEQLSEQVPQFRPILTIEKIDPNLLIIPDEGSDSEKDHLIKSLPTKLHSFDIFNGVSLPSIPVDNLQIDELCLSHKEQTTKISDDPVITSDLVSNTSSKMVKSIDSMDFQLTNDASTETKRDIICVPRSLLEFLTVNIQEIKKELNSVKLDIRNNINENQSSDEQVKSILSDVTEKINLCCRATTTTSSSKSVKHMAKSSNFEEVVDQRSLSNSFQISHKDFTKGDTVCFFGYLVNNSFQWRMISTDNKIYFLNDDCFTAPQAPRRQRRESSAIQQSADPSVTGHSDMSQSQISSESNNVNFVPLSLQTVRGIYLSREEYICKKMTNRYGLPINTKFFRVKANIDWISSKVPNC